MTLAMNDVDDKMMGDITNLTRLMDGCFSGGKFVAIHTFLGSLVHMQFLFLLKCVFMGTFMTSTGVTIRIIILLIFLLV